ncbi:unnamed protein product [Closterium sp. Naga37s-1]|nr:unnamed protein product [Closterium sp. Naga37s-1]
MGAHVSRHVDERLDDLEVYQRAVAATFSERSKPPSDGVDAAPGIQQAQLLDACKAVLQVCCNTTFRRHSHPPSLPPALPCVSHFAPLAVPMVSSPPPIFCSFSRNPFPHFSSSSSRHLPSSPPLSPCQRISAELDPRAGRVCLRVPTPRDLDFALSRHPALAQLPILSFAEFERVTRCVLKRVAADRGRRLLLFVTGGVIAGTSPPPSLTTLPPLNVRAGVGKGSKGKA